MLVRMITTSAGPSGGWTAGDVLDRDDGSQLVSAGVAVPARRAVEHATIAPLETADRPNAGRHRRKSS